ncbi:MAG: tRNA-splicing endonuclease subunit [Cirrosporium novae-zelandiae]|nr:MAG: tRNA-splicing endonuclease subunit [Cirrosporium novae-zelandiae]
MELPTPSPVLPLPVSRIQNRYFIFSPDDAHYLRTQHRILGVQIGGLSQFPAQNRLLGLPLELMPEEVRLLAEKGVAYVVDDSKLHYEGLRAMTVSERRGLRQEVEQEGMEIALEEEKKRKTRQEEILKTLKGQQGLKNKKKGGKLEKNTSQDSTSLDSRQGESKEQTESLFESSPNPLVTASNENSQSESKPSELQPYGITHFTTSSASLPPPSPLSAEIPIAHSSYPLFKHLHSLSYVMSPGIRFGCQYMVYPGDPVAYHSHFLATGVKWEEEIDLLDIVGGGRLGTGVKKGYLFGGLDENSERVRTLCVEWAGM